MRIFKTKSFKKWADNSGVIDKDLVILALNIEEDSKNFTSLGSGIYKTRIATKKSKGKSSGSRIILALKVKNNSIYVYAFDKNEKANISVLQKEKFKQFAKEFFKWSDDELDVKVDTQILYEIEVEEENGD